MQSLSMLSIKSFVSSFPSSLSKEDKDQFKNIYDYGFSFKINENICYEILNQNKDVDLLNYFLIFQILIPFN